MWAVALVAQLWVLIWALTGGRAESLGWRGRLLLVVLSTAFWVWLLRAHRRRWRQHHRQRLAAASGTLLLALLLTLVVTAF